MLQNGSSRLTIFEEEDESTIPAGTHYVDVNRTELKHLIENAGVGENPIESNFAVREACAQVSPLKVRTQAKGTGSANTLAEIPGWAEAAAKLVRRGTAAERAVAAGAPYGRQSSLLEPPIANSMFSAGETSEVAYPDFEERLMSPTSPSKSRSSPTKFSRRTILSAANAKSPTALKAKLAERRLKSLIASQAPPDVREVKTGPPISPTKAMKPNHM
eukprot:gene24279-23333_t